MQQTQLIRIPTMQTPHILLLLIREPNAHHQRLENRPRNLPQPPIEHGREGSKTRQDIFRQPDVIMLSVRLAPNLVALLHKTTP